MLLSCPKERWQSVRSWIRDAAARTICTRRHKRQQWPSDETHNAINEKAVARLRDDHVQRKRLQATYKSLSRRDKDACLIRVAAEAEEDAATGKMGSVFRAIRVISAKNTSAATAAR